MTGELAAALVLDVAAVPSEIRSCRRAVAEHLSRRSVPSVIVDDLELVTSELVTNAVVHASSAGVHVELLVVDDVVLRVANVGSAAALPPVDDWRLEPSPPEAGRGLGIVRRLCDDVTVEQHGERVVITCRRRLPDGGANP